ncbi:hypothetical protein ABH935_000581 [Catenulispora sp. GAS73]|uniref:SHOCT domain-containing protein n=1 Tax=Catenulispora sp. GAS73 TaxID=3156269 RepID=UPI003516B8AE
MGKKDPLPPGATRIEGTDGTITFDGRNVTITHTWLSNAGRGEAQIPLGAVAGVNVKNGMVLAAVTVVVAGGGTPRKGKDPFTVNGCTKQDAAAFRDLLVTAIATPEASGLVEQLQKLAALHTQGMLTAEEFGIAKAKLLGTSTPEDDVPQPW